MAKRKVLMIVVLFLASMIVTGFMVNVYSQQSTETSKTPAEGKKQPTVRQPFQNRFQWQVGLEVIADLSADKLAYTGVCPTTVTFKGNIYSNRAMTVHYRFLRSDNIRTTPITLKLAKDEKKEVTHSWELGGAKGSPDFNGWVFLQVIYPTNMKIVSNVVNFKGTCTNQEAKSTQENTKQQNLSGPQGGQKAPGLPSTGSPAQLSGAKGPVQTGPPIIQQGQTGQLMPNGPPLMPPPQGAQGQSSMPMPKPGQGPANMPMSHPGQKGPMPDESPMLPGTGKGPVPGILLVPQPDSKTLPGTEK